jgi:hypothetical protein
MERWSAPAAAPATAITVQHKGGLLASEVSLDDFRQLPDTDLPRIERVEIVVGARYGPPSTRLVAEARWSPAITVEVEVDDDRSRAEGLADRLASVVDGGSSPPRWLSWEARVALTWVMMFIAAVFLALTINAYASRQIDLRTCVLFSASAVALLWVAVLAGFLLPELEVLRLGQHTRLRRFAGVAAGLLIAFVGGLAAGLVLNLFH